MAVQEQEKMNKGNRRSFFEWKFEDFHHLLSTYRFSSKFKFYGGVSHFLTSNFYDSYAIGAYCMFRLCGCPNPLKACEPCFYTICLINSEGIECFATKGKLEKCSKTVLMAVTENSLRENCHKGSVTVRLSWFKDKGVCEKGIQTEPVNSSDGFQSTTRSKLSQLSFVKDMDNAVNSSIGFQSSLRSKLSQLSFIKDIKDIDSAVSYVDGLRSIQTDISPLSTTRDLDNTDEYPSLNQYISCLISPHFFETLSSAHAGESGNRADNSFFLIENEVWFPVHRVVLSSSSAICLVAYYIETMDMNSGESNIRDADDSLLSDSLHNNYLCRQRGLTADTAVAMCETANKLSLIQMKRVCMKFLMSNLTMDNICEAAVMADKQKEPELRKKVVGFIGEKLEELQETDRWKEFLNMNPLLASKLLSSALIANKKSKKKVSFK